MAKVHALRAEVARKIAAGEVIDRPAAIVRELMDNAVDSGASKISVEIEGGGIEKIRVTDNGSGMDREDLKECARPHATSKISEETDLLNLSTLGFRGEALASMAAVSRLEITSGGFKMCASVTEDHVITPCPSRGGTIVQTSSLFENFPARRQFLKRPASEAVLCRSMFEEKVLPRPDIEFSFTSDGEEKLNLPATDSLTERFVQTMEFFETPDLFYCIKNEAEDKSFSFSLIIGEPSVTRSNRKNIYIYVNGRRITEYSLIQAIEYGCEGYFPNGTHPVACLFVEMNPSLVDFNIHPAKKEARFKDISALHHSVSSSVKNFFKQYTVKTLVNKASEENAQQELYPAETSQSESSLSIEAALVNRYAPKNLYSGRSLSYGSSRETQKPSHFERKTFSFDSGISGIPAEEEPSFIKENYIPSQNEEDGFHFAGSVLGTFLLAEKDGALYIIDQHAAHERILFNRILEEKKEKQHLLIPYVLETESPADDNYLEAIKESLTDAGFGIRKVSEGKWEFDSVPAFWKGKEADLKKDLLSKRLDPSDIIRATAASAACRSAVMDGTVLDNATAAALARDALLLPDPHCPHGRPVYTVITRKQLFELVKRT
ncbi:MAG: DNA mismatch repair endonuclease MutL [Treponema sp.]|nr:DNA mismatch repair endonuclease MutL [Treponema sp.]